MKAKRFLTTVLSGGLALMTLFSFAGCGENSAEELKKQIAELTAQVQGLETALKEEQDKNAQNEQTIKELNQLIQALKNENESKENGELYFLREAYDLGVITQEDLKSIAYYCNQESNLYNEDILDEKFLPKPKNPATLGENIKKKIQNCYADILSDLNLDNEGDGKPTVLNYFGCYNGAYAVAIAPPGEFPNLIQGSLSTVADINFYQINYLAYFIWVERV